MNRIFKKNLKISVSALEDMIAKTPRGSEFKAVKLTYEQAMAFESYNASFDELLAIYGSSNRLKPNEHYDGYIAVSHRWGEVSIIHLIGALQRIDPSEAVNYPDEDKAEVIREGICWRVICQNSDGSSCPEKFNYVWTFNKCKFAKTIANLQEEYWLPSDMDAEATDKILKDKLIAALCGNKIVEVSYAEDDILKEYFGEDLFYYDIFSEVEVQ